MTALSYKRPPITEAVIEVRFSSPIKETSIAKVAKYFKKQYENESKKIAYSLKVDMASTNVEKTGEKFLQFSSNDMTQIFILKKASFILSQRAPYTSWEDHIARFERDFCLLRKHAGHQEIKRIGVRYINRIDIPLNGQTTVEESEYLNIYPKYPPILGNLDSYAIQQRSNLNSIGARLTINSAVVPSPLAQHSSIMFDQDIARETDPPQKTEDVILFLNQVRSEKNSIFEACITDKARGLFNNE